jgi:hypothetical protein
MQNIEERDVAAKIRKRGRDILKTKFDVMISPSCDLGATIDLARIQVEAKDRLGAATLPQIKSEQPHSAADIEDRLGRLA